LEWGWKQISLDEYCWPTGTV